jgi:hypothetical protein
MRRDGHQKIKEEKTMRIATIIYQLAIACWLGGDALFTFVLTPTLFTSYSRDVAGGIVGVLFPGYFQWGLICGLMALLCLLLIRGRRVLMVGGVVVTMLAITAVQAFIIEPRAAELKKQIPSFVTTPPDHPARVQFRKLHGVSAVANLVVIGGGVLLIIFSSASAPKQESYRLCK